MGVTQLRLENFRSFGESEYQFAPKTAVIGNNGVGKSNLLEALRLLSVGKSFKSSRLDDTIRFEELFFRLKLEQTEVEPRSVEFFYGQQFEGQPGRDRSLKVNAQESSWNEFWGVLPSVLFVPTDIEIVVGSPQVRRRYLDSLLWQTSREFRQSHIELTRVLRERSALLFLIKTNRAGPGELSPWNELLLALTDKIRTGRKDFVGFLSRDIERSAKVFTSGAKVELSYEENLVEPDAVYKEEVRLSQNLVGPHRDELEIRFNDQSARRFTSRGQARAIVVILKLAEAAFLTEETKRSPLILLDDMFSELDQETAGNLFAQFGDTYQIVASSIEPNSLIKGWKQIVLP